MHPAASPSCAVWRVTIIAAASYVTTEFGSGIVSIYNLLLWHWIHGWIVGTCHYVGYGLALGGSQTDRIGKSGRRDRGRFG